MLKRINVIKVVSQYLNLNQEGIMTTNSLHSERNSRVLFEGKEWLRKKLKLHYLGLPLLE
jgi:hypothetical protein